ncbi:unnamed protein product [Dracunculus medinensis]|uniref:BPI2 domain-containing protein n=1 Tax=Dracunculus medinensis TaxID=318479 RepID=A0A0N4UJ59_DRAME|nr:unnamed protein product [Dracunculus medinensis]
MIPLSLFLFLVLIPSWLIATQLIDQSGSQAEEVLGESVGLGAGNANPLSTLETLSVRSHQPLKGFGDKADLKPPYNGEQIPAGIYFRISQKGIDYITELAAKALPELLEKAVIPTVEQPQIKISKLTIENFKLVIDDLRQRLLILGVGANVYLPLVTVTAIYDASTFFSTYTGKFKAEIENLTINMEVHISRNEDAKLNIIKAKMNLYKYRSLIEQSVINVLGNEICQIPIKVTHFFEQQKRHILMTTASPQPTTPTPTHLLVYGAKFEESFPTYHTTVEEHGDDDIDEDNPFYNEAEENFSSMMSFEEEEDLAAKFAADLCAEDRLDMGNDVLMSGEQIHLEKRKRSINDVQRLNPLLKEGQWAPDLTLMYPPKFTNEDVVFGLDGGIIFFGQKATNISRPHMLNVSALGDQMFGLLVSEYVPNTFFSHVYNNRLGIIQETFKANNLPKFARLLAKMVCSNCQLQLIANLTSRPELRVDRAGVQLDIEGEIGIIFVAKSKTRTLVNAYTKLDITIRPYLKHSRIYGEVALTGVDIKIKGMGVSGVFSKSIKKALNAVVPRKLWPKIKKRLRFALSQRGIKLPVMCGVELERPSLSYIDHAIVIDTDFSPSNKACAIISFVYMT